MKKLGNILNKSIKKVITQNKQKQLYMKGGTLSIRDEENFENYINLKTLIIYNEQLIKIDEFIVEQVTNISQIKKQSKKEDDEDAEIQTEEIYNTSTLTWRKNLYYFKRIFPGKGEGSHLQLFRLEYKIKGEHVDKDGNKLKEQPDDESGILETAVSAQDCDGVEVQYRIEEPIKGKEVNQYNVIFSTEFGQKT